MNKKFTKLIRKIITVYKFFLLLERVVDKIHTTFK